MLAQYVSITSLSFIRVRYVVGGLERIFDMNEVVTCIKLGRLTLEDCMKRFLAPEHVENYFCSHCWHIAAIKFLSLVGGRQVLAYIFWLC